MIESLPNEYRRNMMNNAGLNLKKFFCTGESGGEEINHRHFRLKEISCFVVFPKQRSDVTWSSPSRLEEPGVAPAVMEEIIEHHVEEETEKRRRHETSSSFLESIAGPRSTHSTHDSTQGSTQSSHRLLAYSDALISIIATVMVGLLL